MSRRKKVVLAPWDLLRGRDVFRDVSQLDDVLSFTCMAHWAPNCATFSRARERPIPGVKNAPKPVRNESFPGVLADMSEKSRKRLDLDTARADMAARDCLKRLGQGREFGLEHPEGSIARHLPSWKRLQSEPGVFCTKYHACMFSPCKRRKRQILIHNVPELDIELGRVCHSERRCERTGCSHLSWKPKVDKGKIIAFSTGDEREYPLEFCEAYARVLSSRQLNNEGFTFVEVFSGPNAPLSCAVAKAFGELPPPPPKLVDTAGITSELNDIKQASIGSSVDDLVCHAPSHLQAGESCLHVLPKHAEEDPYRLAAVDSGRQPTYGKRLQLIPDSGVDPESHLTLAKRLEHPFSQEGSLKEDHKRAIETITSGESLGRKRLSELDKLIKLVSRPKADS